MIVTIEAVNLALADRLEQLCERVIKGKRDKRGREWIGGHRKDGGPGDSVQVRLVGDKRGKWRHLATHKGGDPLGLICEFQTGGDMRAAFKWAIDWLGGDVPVDTAEQKLHRQKMAERVAREERRRRESLIGFARDIWRHCESVIINTPVDFYLKARRIDLRALPHAPGWLRYAPALMHPDLQEKFPAMVAGVLNSQGELMGIHRTFLIHREAGWDRVREEHEGADIEGKMQLGACEGHSIHLWDGAHRRGGVLQPGVAWAGPRGMSYVRAGEGIENVLSLVLADMAHPYIAVMSVGNFRPLVLPRQCRRIEWWGDNDGNLEGANRATLQAVADGIEAHRAAGREVRVIYPPAGRKGWNDVLVSGVPADWVAANNRYWGA